MKKPKVLFLTSGRDTPSRGVREQPVSLARLRDVLYRAARG